MVNVLSTASAFSSEPYYIWLCTLKLLSLLLLLPLLANSIFDVLMFPEWCSALLELPVFFCCCLPGQTDWIKIFLFLFLFLQSGWVTVLLWFSNSYSVIMKDCRHCWVGCLSVCGWFCKVLPLCGDSCCCCCCCRGICLLFHLLLLLPFSKAVNRPMLLMISLCVCVFDSLNVCLPICFTLFLLLLPSSPLRDEHISVSLCWNWTLIGKTSSHTFSLLWATEQWMSSTRVQFFSSPTFSFGDTVARCELVCVCCCSATNLKGGKVIWSCTY